MKGAEFFGGSERPPGVFGDAGVAQGVGKFAGDLPNGLASGCAEAAFDEQRPLLPDDGFYRTHFRADGRFLAIQLDDEMRAATAEPGAFGPLISGGEGKGVG